MGEDEGEGEQAATAPRVGKYDRLQTGCSLDVCPQVGPIPSASSLINFNLFVGEGGGYQVVRNKQLSI